MTKLNEVLKKIERLLPYMNRETLETVLAVVREYGPKLAAAEAGGMPANTVQEMVKAVPDQLMRDIVNDLRVVPDPGWLPPSGSVAPVVRGSGWSEPLTEDRSRQFDVFDRMVAGMVGGPNDTSKLK